MCHEDIGKALRLLQLVPGSGSYWRGERQTMLVMAIPAEQLSLLCISPYERLKKRILLGSDMKQNLSCMLCVSNRDTDILAVVMG